MAEPALTELEDSPSSEGRPLWEAALGILAAGLEAADADAAVRRALEIRDGTLAVTGFAGGRERTPATTEVPWPPSGRTVLVAAGKAARPMVTAAEALLGDAVSIGIGVTVPEFAGTTGTTTLHRGGHPLPDPGSLMAGRHIARVLDGLTPDDLVVVLLSGGASALLELPADGVPLADLQTATSAVMASGATIDELNTVRKHLSRVKGGQLARLAAPARVVCLVVSDVVGNPLDVVGSGPTVPDTSTFADAAEVVARRQLWGELPNSAADHLRAGADGRRDETPKPEDPLFGKVSTVIVADNATAVAAAAEAAEAAGYPSRVLTTFMEGEARDVGRFMASVAKEMAAFGRPAPMPGCVVAGGETTVTLRRLAGQGGRNQDGDSAAAGAVVDGSTASRSRQTGRNPVDALDHHDSGGLFAELGDQIITGPTGTNVNDLVVVVAGPPG